MYGQSLNASLGDELYNYLLHHGPIAPGKVQKIFTQLVGAVAYVHNMSCVHRDLKLENILLDKNENVKLCDFGFTREYDGKMSYLQTFCGTVCYSAPEMLKGEKYAGERVDVWSLGIILFALLTGELPFDDDNEMATKHKILTTELTYPDSVPADAKALIGQLLSKRPLLRPTLADILTNPFLAEHAPQQQAILKLTQPPPFTTDLEKQTLERMRSAGVDIDKVIENVLAQRCDGLAGWWALLVEKEQRKERRRDRKRKERELEAKNLRRLSAASSRLERISAPLKEVDEDDLSPPNTDGSRRGRRDRRSLGARKSTCSGCRAWLTCFLAQLILPELPQLPEGTVIDSPQSATPPPPIEKDPMPPAGLTDYKPQPPPKERRRSRGSTLQLMATKQDLLAPPNGMPKGRSGRRSSRHPFINQLASIKHWFVESAKRAKSPSNKSEVSTLKPPLEKRSPKETRTSPIATHQSPAVSTPPQQHHQQQSRTAYIAHARITTPRNRASLSPAPLTPRSSYRHSSAGTLGLRGRKSTSSSVSSIRSIHHVHTHSKASSTSSTSNSVHSSAFPSVNSASKPSGRSPHSSVKVLPSTPTASTFPSNIRLVRGPPNNLYNESAFPSSSSASGGGGSFVFAKRKKTPFRGPMLSLNASGNFAAPSGSGSGSPAPHRAGRVDNGGGGSRSASQVGRTSGEIIEEEDEDEVEEVDAFSPIGAGAEETVWEEGGGDVGGGGERKGERERESGDWIRMKGKGS